MPVGDISSFADCMPTTVTREPFSVMDKYGQRSYGAGVAILSRVQEKQERVTIASGEEVLSRGKVYMAEIVGWDTSDRITLPDGTTPEILAVQKLNDENGPHHEVVIFK